MRDKNQVFDALEVLNKINMEYEKFCSDCSHCKIYGTGSVQFNCNQQGYCPVFLSDPDKEQLKILV